MRVVLSLQQLLFILNSSEARNQAVKTVTMATVARLTGVSQGAISSLLNDRDYGIRVSAATRKKVFETCRQLGYVPNDLRAIVRMYPERGDLAVLWPSLSPGMLEGDFGPRFLQGVRAGFEKPDAPLTLFEFSSDGENGAVPPAVLEGVISRVITVGAVEPAAAGALQSREIRHVAVEAEPPSPGVPSIHADYAQAAFLALRHLRETGHRNIAVITSDAPGFALRDKLLGAGVKAATRELKLTIDRTIASQPGWRFHDGPEIAAKLAGSPLRVSAVFCYSEEVAAGLIAAMQAVGRRLPEFLSVISCGDGAVGRQLHPALTTVRIPVEAMGTRAVQVLAELAESSGKPRPIVLPVELVVRGSVCPPEA